MNVTCTKLATATWPASLTVNVTASTAGATSCGTIRSTASTTARRVLQPAVAYVGAAGPSLCAADAAGVTLAFNLTGAAANSSFNVAATTNSSRPVVCTSASAVAGGWAGGRMGCFTKATPCG